MEENAVAEPETETNANELNARVTIEVSGHASEDGRTSADIEREQEARRQAVEDDEETD